MRYKSIVTKIFIEQAKPLTVMDILAILEIQHLSPNKTTLYRLLEKLYKEGIINKVGLDTEKTFFEYIKNDHHHHHLVCEKCKKVKEYVLPQQLENKILNLSNNWKINNHNFELFGECPDCQKAKK